MRKWEGSRKQVQLQQQLPPSEPPTAPQASRPQPLPLKRRVAEVFSSYDALPVAAQMVKRLVQITATQVESATVWVGAITVDEGYVFVARSMITYPLNLTEGPNPAALKFTPQRNGAAVPFVDTVDIQAGDTVPMYMVVGAGESCGFQAIVQGEFIDAQLSVLICGEMLRSRGLVPELEIGHDAPLVKPIPPDPQDLA